DAAAAAHAGTLASARRESPSLPAARGAIPLSHRVARCGLPAGLRHDVRARLLLPGQPQLRGEPAPQRDPRRDADLRESERQRTAHLAAELSLSGIAGGVSQAAGLREAGRHAIVMAW